MAFFAVFLKICKPIGTVKSGLELTRWHTGCTRIQGIEGTKNEGHCKTEPPLMVWLKQGVLV